MVAGGALGRRAAAAATDRGSFDAACSFYSNEDSREPSKRVGKHKVNWHRRLAFLAGRARTHNAHDGMADELLSKR